MSSGWKELRLNDFVWFQRGYDLPKTKFEEGTVPVYGSTSILGYHNEAKVKAPGVVTGRSGTLGTMQYVQEDFWPHNTTLWVKDFKGNNERFTYYLLSGLDFSVFNSGGAVPTLNRNVLNAFVVSIPSLQMQQKIADILSTYDDLIENNLKRIELLEEQAQLTYEQWFVRMKFPDYENTVIDNEMGLPEGWSSNSIENVVTVTSSKRIFLADYIDKGIPFYRGKEIILKSKNEPLNDRLYISRDKFNEIKRKYGVPTTGDILVTAVGTLGYPYLVTNDDGDFYFKDGNLIWLKNNDLTLSTYLICLFKDSGFRKILDNIAIGSSQKALTIKSIKALKVTTPSEPLLKQFNNLIQPTFDMISNLQIQNKLLKEARDILLPRLMTGMIEV